MIFLLVVAAVSAWFLRRGIFLAFRVGFAAVAVVALIGATTALLMLPHEWLSP